MFKAIFMMDQRRQVHAARKQSVRHNAVHRPPIVAEYKVESLHIAREAAIAAHAWHSGEGRRCVFWKVDLHTTVECACCPKGVVDGRKHCMLCLIAKMVHQANRARFLTAYVKTAMQMEDADRRHTCLSFMHRPDAIYE